MAARQGRYASYARNERRNSQRNTYGAGNAYVDGNTVRKYNYDVVRELEKEPEVRISRQTRKNRERAALMNLGTVCFLFASLCVAGMILYGYLALQAENTAISSEIATLESQLNTMKLDNDEEYSRIMSSVNMEEIKTRAIEDLGMQYAQEGQVIEVQGVSDDYVRQYKDMP